MAKILSIQSGTSSVTGSPTNITMSAVTLANTVLIAGYKVVSGHATQLQHIELTSTTNIQVTLGNYASTPQVTWYVIEYDSDVSVQTGSTQMSSATQNEINAKDGQNLVDNGVGLISEGANMPSVPEAVDLFVEHGLLYGPGKAANAGGVAVSGLEMAQNSMRLSWPKEEVDKRLKQIMKSIHKTCVDACDSYEVEGNYVAGANIAGFVKVVNAMLDQGLV